MADVVKFNSANSKILFTSGGKIAFGCARVPDSCETCYTEYPTVPDPIEVILPTIANDTECEDCADYSGTYSLDNVNDCLWSTDDLTGGSCGNGTYRVKMSFLFVGIDCYVTTTLEIDLDPSGKESHHWTDVRTESAVSFSSGFTLPYHHRTTDASGPVSWHCDATGTTSSVGLP